MDVDPGSDLRGGQGGVPAPEPGDRRRGEVAASAGAASAVRARLWAGLALALYGLSNGVLAAGYLSDGRTTRGVLHLLLGLAALAWGADVLRRWRRLRRVQLLPGGERGEGA